MTSHLLNINNNVKRVLETKMKYTNKFFIYKYCEIFLILSKYSMTEQLAHTSLSLSQSIQLDTYLAFISDLSEENMSINKPVPKSIPENILFVSLVRSSDQFVLDHFIHVLDLLQSIESKSTVFIQQMKSSIEILKSYYYENQKSCIDIEQVPSEFLDPLLNTLMIDPVRLPCGIVCDRYVILRHLMEHTTDPFTRQYLSEDMLEEDTDLRDKIAAFIKDQQQKKIESEK